MNDLLLLANLLGGPLHGYALKKQVGLVTGNPDMHNNLVYPLLRRFVAQHWVNQKKAAGERGQTRVVYSLTPAGRAELLRRLSEFGDADARSSEAFQLRVGLFEFLDAAAREQILARRKSYLEARGENLAHLQERIELGAYAADVVRFLRDEARAELVWVEHLSRMRPGGAGKKSRERRRESR